MQAPKAPDIGPQWYRQKIGEIIAWCETLKPVSGIGTQVSDSAGGRVVNAQPGGIGGSLSLTHPFQTFLRTNPANPEQYQAKVALGSNLYAGLGNWGNITIIGLDAWFNVSSGDYIYLTGTYVDGEIDEVNLDNGSSLPGRVVITTGDEPKQTSWTTRVSRIITAGEGDSLIVEQNLFQHLTLVTRCLSVPIEYPVPLS